MTTISDKVYSADGSPASGGTITISWPRFTAVAGHTVPKGYERVSIADDGSFSVSLEPSDTAVPTSVYTVQYDVQGQAPYSEHWSVPTSATPLTIAQVVVSEGVNTPPVVRLFGKGDIGVFDGTVTRALPVGSNGTVLVADSTQSKGVKWGSVAAGEVTGLADVATSGSYTDLSNKPSIPASTSDITNNSGYITAAQAPVQSVNGSTGAVTIPVVSKTSQLTNDSNFVPASGVVPVTGGTFTGSVTVSRPGQNAIETDGLRVDRYQGANMHLQLNYFSGAGHVMGVGNGSQGFLRLGTSDGTTQKDAVYVDSTSNVGIGPGATTPPSTLSVGSTYGFQVDGSGNVKKINGAATSFPAANAPGVLTNDGAGNLSYSGDAVGTNFKVWGNQPGAAVPAIFSTTSDMLNGGTGLMVQNRVSPQSTPGNYNNGRGVLIGDVGLNSLVTPGTEKIDMGMIRDAWSLLLNRNMKYDAVNACWDPIINDPSYPYTGDLLELGAEGISMHVLPAGQSSNSVGISGMIMSWRPTDVRVPDASGNDTSLGTSNQQRVQVHAPIYISYTANNKEFYHHGATSPAIHILEDGSGLNTPIQLENCNSTLRAGAKIEFRKSGGNPSYNGQTIVTTNDNPMILYSYAHDGTGYQLGAGIITVVRGTPSAGNVGQDLRLRTSASGTATDIADRLSITHDGKVGVGTVDPVALFSVGSTSQFQIDTAGSVIGNHIGGSQSLHPTIAAGPGLGASPTVNVFGNDTDMTILVTTGTGTASGALFTITWATPFAAGQAPRCIAGPANSDTALADSIWPTANTTSVTWSIPTPLNPGTAYEWYVHVAY